MKYRTLFLSDIHLGTPGCQAELLLDFLNSHDADSYYLVGDIIDAWRIQRKGFLWPQAHNDVVQAILAKAHDGADIYLIPGNHDEFLRSYLGTHFGGIEVVQTADFIAADNKRYLVTHGDQFDSVVVNAKWLAHLGDRAYDFMLWLNTRINRLRHLWGGQYWSLSKWAKHQVKQAVNFISEYENVLTAEARRGGYDGVICGHIHSAALRDIGEISYVNTGDWVESCTAVAEQEDGQLVLIDWTRSARRAHHRSRRARRKDKQSEKDRQLENV
ncbi:MAG: UDP-2,3-diacylglucosamine diphosphatase [Pseudophaeobacter sp. bin_em_oilr2.035]|uniref:UDP-2,3-diacylglucosamine diphosphatase n=1 Tax=Phaeobacter TaxID=302485 RepID=UPI00237F7CD7|nr:UDP-2,3-diacylglucosamine diphosphatase [Phaeobacter gallaeciensis]MDF1774173.1 UDP-2,3-diacylglucosamine diphosphatase [Pseudophaeobacter sp. bin_em_oilr2.035]MEE2634985.1 UDP-2,3-diacylglucosamine diphosphatase [Pseudomonadota bacterium]MDE4062917.1 UDP-2,3-diacylglucosamine diphosphatase [Phaeobacter gallaeciensis]MDE4125938.1 UDP-2,3-diacylglucosamine diphosphatase [Phaeobacter gallaeciensis]MDE4130402.1 UDP-2,3-diacylglucosamine diphosphatase [Phaeobacter gallaeciensis]